MGTIHFDRVDRATLDEKSDTPLVHLEGGPVGFVCYPSELVQAVEDAWVGKHEQFGLPFGETTVFVPVEAMQRVRELVDRLVGEVA